MRDLINEQLSIKKEEGTTWTYKPVTEHFMLKATGNGAVETSPGEMGNNCDIYESHIDYLCPQCGQEFTKKQDWRAHISQAHGLNHIAFLSHSRFKTYLRNLPYKFYNRCRKCQKCYVHRKQLVCHLVTVHRILPQPNPQHKDQSHSSKQTVTVANETFEITFLDDEPKSIQRSFQSRKVKAKAFNDRSYSPPPPPPNSPTSHCYKCKECNSLHNSLVALKMHIRRRHFLNGKYTTSKYITAKSANSNIKEGNLVRIIDRMEDSRETIIPAKKLPNVESINGNTTEGSVTVTPGLRPAKKVVTKGSIGDREIGLTISTIHPPKKLKHDESSILEKVTMTIERKKDHSLTDLMQPPQKVVIPNGSIKKEETAGPKQSTKNPANQLVNGLSKTIPNPAESPVTTSMNLPVNNIQDNFVYICPACGLVYKKELDWRRHINGIHHFNKFPHLKMRIRDKNLYQCLMCRGSLLASHLKPLQEHHFRHLPHRLYIKCSVCATSYNYKPNLLTHSVQCPKIAKERHRNVSCNK